MVAVMRGENLPVPSTRSPRPSRARYPQRPKIEHRLIAAQWLADRGWGKAKELIELTGDATTTPEQRLAILRRLSDDERGQLRQLLAKALSSAPAPAAPDPPAAVDLEVAGAPVDLGRPRNVARAIAPELSAADDPGGEYVSPLDSPPIPPDPAPDAP
jgi:hypothetical protein